MELVLITVLMGSVISLSPSVLAAEGKRVAFVVGIGTYDSLPDDKQLRNSVNDAEGVSAKLAEIGFQVTKGFNLTRLDFRMKWLELLNGLTEEDTFVLFYSGHGVQIRQQNYLLPRDIPSIDRLREELVTTEGISLTAVLNDLTQGRGDRPPPKRVVVIIDACRDNPFILSGSKGMKTSTGLTKPSSTEGLFIIYSAAENSVSLDRLPDDDKSVKYSVFTRALLPLITRPIKLQDLSLELKKSVMSLTRNTRGQQRPAYYDGTDGEEFCLPGCNGDWGRPGPIVLSSPPQVVPPIEKLPSIITGNDGGPMVFIPAGKFTMGSSEDDKSAQYAERPTHTVYLDAYYLDQFEVTTARYATFLQRTSRVASAYWSEQILKQHGNKPVVGVDWNDAAAYCVWAGKRLPTEAEWEKAARGTDHRLYPWGDAAPNQRLANYGRGSDFKNYEVLTNVGSYELGKSPYGAYDMAGNVWEWTADWYDENYYGKSSTRNPRGSSSGQSRVVRGGSWGDASGRMRSTLRDRRSPTGRHNFIGFRCVQDVPN